MVDCQATVVILQVSHQVLLSSNLNVTLGSHFLAAAKLQGAGRNPSHREGEKITYTLFYEGLRMEYSLLSCSRESI